MKNRRPSQSSSFIHTHTPPRWLVAAAIHERIRSESDLTLVESYNSPKFSMKMDAVDCAQPQLLSNRRHSKLSTNLSQEHVLDNRLNEPADMQADMTFAPVTNAVDEENNTIEKDHEMLSKDFAFAIEASEVRKSVNDLDNDDGEEAEEGPGESYPVGSPALSAETLVQEFIEQGMQLFLHSKQLEVVQAELSNEECATDVSGAILNLILSVQGLDQSDEQMPEKNHEQEVQEQEKIPALTSQTQAPEVSEAEVDLLLDRAAAFLQSYAAHEHYRKIIHATSKQADTASSPTHIYGKVHRAAQRSKPSAISSLPADRRAVAHSLRTQLTEVAHMAQNAQKQFQAYQLPPFSVSSGPNLQRYAVSKAMDLTPNNQARTAGLMAVLKLMPKLAFQLKRAGAVLPPGMLIPVECIPNAWPTPSLQHSTLNWSQRMAAGVDADTGAARRAKAAVEVATAKQAEEAFQRKTSTLFNDLLKPDMTRLDCVFTVSHCSGCRDHSTLRHNSSKYYNQAIEMLQWLGQQCIAYRPAVRLGLLRVPRSQRSDDCTSAASIGNTFSDRLQIFHNRTNTSTGQRSGSDNDHAVCTALGAFEVQVSLINANGVFHSRCLHSKVRSGHWPNRNNLRQRLFAFFREHTNKLLPWNDNDSVTATGDGVAEVDLALSKLHLSIPICAYPKQCKRGCRAHNTQDRQHGAVVLTSAQSYQCLESSLTELRAVKPGSDPPHVTQMLDYSFESSLHLFSVGDVVDVRQLAPLGLSPRRRHRKFVQSKTKTSHTNARTLTSTNSGSASGNGLHDTNTDFPSKPVSAFSLSAYRLQDALKDFGLINTAHVPMATSTTSFLNKSLNCDIGTKNSEHNENKATSPQRLRCRIHAERAISPSKQRQQPSLFAQGLCNRVPFQCGAAPVTNYTRSHLNSTVTFFQNFNSEEKSSMFPQRAAAIGAAAATVPAFVPDISSHSSPTRPGFRTGPSTYRASSNSVNHSMNIELGKMSEYIGDGSKGTPPPQQELWYSQGFLRGVVTSAHRDGTYDIAYLPVPETATKHVFLSHIFGSCSIDGVPLNQNVNSTAETHSQQLYVLDFNTPYASLADRRKAGFVDVGVEQAFVTTCRNVNASPSSVSVCKEGPAMLPSLLPQCTAHLLPEPSVCADHANDFVGTVTATALPAIAGCHTAVHVCAFTEDALRKERRPWRQGQGGTSSETEATLTNVNAVLQQVFEDEDGMQPDPTEQTPDDGTTTTLLEERAYEALPIFANPNH